MRSRAVGALCGSADPRQVGGRGQRQAQHRLGRLRQPGRGRSERLLEWQQRGGSGRLRPERLGQAEGEVTERNLLFARTAPSHHRPGDGGGSFHLPQECWL